MTLPENDFSSVLLGIYGAARELPRDELQALALETLRTRVRHDSVIWGVGRHVGARIDLSSYFERETDPQASAAWRDLGGLERDKTVEPGFANPGRAIKYHGDTLYGGADEADIRDYLRRFGRRHYLITATPPGPDGRSQWISLYRAGAGDEFNAAEVGLCQAYVPHLGEALTINLLLGGAHGSIVRHETGQSSIALATRGGELRYAHEGFVTSLCLEWAEFGRDRRLPRSLVAMIATVPTGEYVGRRVRVAFRRAGDLVQLSATERSAVDGLTARRRNVARFYGQGYSSKEIARLCELSPATVRNHIQTIFKELGIHTRAQLRALTREER